MRVMLSYCWKDAAVRKSVSDTLSTIPMVEVIYDKDRISVGESAHAAISEMIDSADLLVAIVTADSLNAREVADELARANERKKLIIPFVYKIGPEQSLPFYLIDSLQIRCNVENFDEKLLILKKEVSRYVEALESRQYTTWRKNSTVFRPNSRDDVDLQRMDLGGELLEQVLVYCGVQNFHIKSDKSDDLSIPLVVCPNVFSPDDWSKHLIEVAYDIIKNRDSKVSLLEVGVGTGAVSIGLSKLLTDKVSKITAIDVDTLACELARINFHIHDLNSHTFILSGLDLSEALHRKIIGPSEQFDIVVANLPQVPTTSKRQIRDYFDYYALPVGEVGEWDHWARIGLWLVARTLRDVKAHLKKDGDAFFVLSGRPTKGQIDGMFERLGYHHYLVLEKSVTQDPNTDISSLVTFERAGAEFEFFMNERCTAKIGARDAYRHIIAGDPVFQKLYVIGAKPLSTKK